MSFLFQNYVQPGWYFSLPIKDNVNSQISSLRQEFIHFETDDRYHSELATEVDTAYRAWRKGVVTDYSKLNKYGTVKNLQDNYRFLRKYFHPLWSWYVLGFRLITLHNPLKEIAAFRSNRKVKRIDLYKEVVPHDVGYQQFDSALVAAQPLVSVIIPTLNRYTYLKDVLQELEQQDYRHFEVIVVDQSEPWQADFYKGFDLNLKVIRQEEPALWLARNTAIRAAKGDIIALAEDDVRLPKDWLWHHLKCLDYFQTDISSGVFFPEGASIPKHQSFFRLADQFATGNACLYKEVFRTTGLFDRQFEKQRMGDGEFGLRAHLAGFKSISNPKAYCIDVKAPVGGLRQMGSWDAFRPKSLLAPRPVPSVLYLYRKYFGNEIAIYALIQRVLPSIIPYRFKRNNYMLLVGSVLAIPLLPLVMIQVIRSWRLASEKLRQGARIEYLPE